MGKGFLVINVYADNIGQPVEGAHIHLIGNNISLKLKTDASGSVENIELPAPEKIYSLQPQTKERPYAVYSIKVTREGLQPTVVEGISILDGEESIQNVYMQSEPEKEAPEQYISIPEHCLWGDYPPKIVVDPITQHPIPSTGDVLPYPLVPEYILVHDGLPTNTAAANYYVSFPDYIKNVASSEIYSTWPKETLKANIYAIMSFTMNRIFTEWYRSSGYFFTITSSTQYDQKFIYGRNIFTSISNVVDEIFNQFIRRGNLIQPFLAQYNDGIKVNNRGWLSQWGSSDLGAKGYSALNILKYYYGDNVSIVTTDVIEGAPSSFPGFNLQLGICGDAVQKIQKQLNVILSSYPAIPDIYPADGKYGPDTKKTVESFQKIFKLPITGIVDFATWYRISYVFVGVSKMLQGRYA